MVGVFTLFGCLLVLVLFSCGFCFSGCGSYDWFGFVFMIAVRIGVVYVIGLVTVFLVGVVLGFFVCVLG